MKKTERASPAGKSPSRHRIVSPLKLQTELALSGCTDSTSTPESVLLRMTFEATDGPRFVTVRRPSPLPVGEPGSGEIAALTHRSAAAENILTA